MGDHKLINFFEDDSVRLYNLKEDIGEQRDLAATMPEKALKMRGMIDDWRRSVGATTPTPNPAYDPSKDPRRN